MQTLEKLLTARLVWEERVGQPEWTTMFLGEECHLVMNDFPDEPLYTLTWRGQSMNFDDTPTAWTLP